MVLCITVNQVNLEIKNYYLMYLVHINNLYLRETRIRFDICSTSLSSFVKDICNVNELRYIHNF
jgi:hypothetical protein